VKCYRTVTDVSVLHFVCADITIIVIVIVIIIIIIM